MLGNPRGPECPGRPERLRFGGAIDGIEETSGVFLAEPDGRQTAGKLGLGIGRPHPRRSNCVGVAVLHEQGPGLGSAATRYPAAGDRWLGRRRDARRQTLEQAADGWRL